MERRHKPEGGVDRSAYDRALGMLARREHSRIDLQKRLERAGCGAAESEAAIGKLQRQHYQDDRRFGEMLVRTRIAQGYGPARLRAELRAHGLAGDAIRALIESAEVDWVAAAAAQVRKRYGPGPAGDRTELARRAAFLLRRGFAAATVRIVTHSEIDDPDA